MVSEFRGIEGLTGQLDVNNILASWVDVRALNQVSGKLWKGSGPHGRVKRNPLGVSGCIF